MKSRPNFIVIHADQLRADCVGINGHRKGIYTPYIDSIAYQGANFTSAYAPVLSVFPRDSACSLDSFHLITVCLPMWEFPIFP